MEIMKKFKDKSFIQSFERGTRQDRASMKHLSDTEDSLILSEKKKTRGSMQHSKQLLINSQNQSSIVDVKIKPIVNMKTGGTGGNAPYTTPMIEKSDNNILRNQSKENIESDCDNSRQEIQYQV